MAATVMLAKLAIPLGVGLLFLASRKGQAKAKTADLAKTLAGRSVEAMQQKSASRLGDTISDWRTDDGDATTADGLQSQQARMIARGSRGFIEQPAWTDDKGLAIDNAEWGVRLLQLEGRPLALDAWVAAYKKVAPNLSKELAKKAKILRDTINPKGKGGSKDKGGASKDSAEEIAAEVADALATNDPAVMRKVAADLRKRGFKSQADALEAAADEIEAEQKGKSEPSPSPSPQPSPKPEPAPEPAPSPEPARPSRTVTVTSKLNSEAAIAKSFGVPSQWPELVKVNIPKDADGRVRQKVTPQLILAKDINPNRLGGLFPGLQPNQKLFVPDNWPKSGGTAPAPKPTPTPKPDQKPKAPSDPQTKNLMIMLVGKNPGKEDTLMVKKWQTQEGRPADGKYGTGDAIHLADRFGVAPPSPLYFSKKDTAGDLKKWQSEMGRLALEHPDQADAFHFAADAGKQPGFNAPSNSKVRSRLFGDGLGAL